MSQLTSIEWTNRTWNPVRGCSRVSEGCRNCYAERMAHRFSGPDGPFEDFVDFKNGHAAWTGKVELIESKLIEPLSWKKPQRVFVNSMSDLFHEALAAKDVYRVFDIMRQCPHINFQILTKRADRLPELVRNIYDLFGLVLPNVWLGVSVEDREHKDRIELLRNTPAALRFLSIEPLLEDVGELDLRGIDWIIAGGESGPGARPAHPDWFRGVRDQCIAADVPFFFKQWGEFLPDSQNPAMLAMESMMHSGAGIRVGKKAAGALLDGIEWKQFPSRKP